MANRIILNGNVQPPNFPLHGQNLIWPSSVMHPEVSQLADYIREVTFGIKPPQPFLFFGK